MNVVTLIGRLTNDIELKYTPNGTAVGKFTLAVNRRVTNKNGDREADFIRCIVWNKVAENLANYTRKGSQIGIQGRIQTGSYENQQGQKVYTTDVVVENFDFLDTKKEGQSSPQNDFSNISDDDLPF